MAQKGGVTKEGSDWEAALSHFKKADPVLYRAALPFKDSMRAKLAPRYSEDKLFSKLAASVVSQQLATKAAASIWKRVEDSCGGVVTAESVASTSLPRLRKAGLSAAKAKTLKELSKAVQKGLSLTSLRRKPHDEALQELTSVWGIGPWTAEMFFMFALGRPDIFSHGDLGLVRSMETLYGLPRESKKEAFLLIAEKWSPHKTYACLVLWAARDTK